MSLLTSLILNHLWCTYVHVLLVSEYGNSSKTYPSETLLNSVSFVLVSDVDGTASVGANSSYSDDVDWLM